jgi:hypothetical protein
MANSLLTPTAVTREALRILHQKLNFVGNITRDYDDSYAKSGAKIGDSLKIRLPNQYTVRTGATLSTQDTTESSVTLQINNQIGVDLNFTSVDLTLSLDDFSKRILDPATAVLAANIESTVLSAVYKDVYQSIWNGGAAATFNKALDARVRLQNSLAPPSDRTMLLDPASMADVVKDTKTLFQDDASLSKQYREGMVGRAAGFDWGENTMMPSHLRGDAASYVCNTSTGITSGTATLTLSGGSGTIKAGDVFTIAGVNEVHPETKVDTGRLQQFVCTADATTAPIVSPTPVTTGALQNIVINSAGASKAVTVAGTASTAVQTGLAFQKGAFAFATADLLMPQGMHFAAREVMDGISMRIVQNYDITNDKFPCRLDVLYGYKTLRPKLAARYHNN